MSYKIVRCAAVLAAVLLSYTSLSAAPTMQWGVMVGDNVNAPAGFRSDGTEIDRSQSTCR